MGYQCVYDEPPEVSIQGKIVYFVIKELPVKEERDYSLTGVESQRAVNAGLAEAEWYKSPVPREAMRELLVRKNGPAVRDTIIWFSLIICSGYLVFLMRNSWVVIFPYIVYSTLYASTSDSRWHESSHGTAFRTDWMNNLLYEISSFMVFRQSTVWRWSHTRHHSDTIIRGRDPEIAVPRPPRLRKLLQAFFGLSGAVPEIKRILKHAAGRIDPQAATYVPEYEYSKVFKKARIYLLIYIAVIALSIIFKSLLPLFLIGLPTLLGSWLMPVYGFTQHAGLQENVLDHRLNCRTVYMNRIHRFLYWNMNYHLEHHMFPLVPYHALPKLHELIKDDCPEPYHGLIEAWKEIIPAILKQRKDPEFYVERNLPAPDKSLGSRSGNRFSGQADKLIDNWMEICPLSALPQGDVIRFDFASRSYAIYRTASDGLFATEGFCTHGNAHLGNGALIGDFVECPGHNGRFRLRDGIPLRAPASIPLNTYKVRLENGNVFLQLPPENDTIRNEDTEFRVVSNKNLSPLIKELIIEPASGDFSGFIPGQYVRFVIPPYNISFDKIHIDDQYVEYWKEHGLFAVYAYNEVYTKRIFSMANNPASGKGLIFNVRIALPPPGTKLAAGAGSSYLFSLQPEDKVKISGPYGEFFIKPTDKEMVYIGGGTGMAPLRSHIAYLFETLGTKRKVSYWYGARRAEDLYYLGYFRHLQEQNVNFTFHPAVSETTGYNNWTGLTGLIHDVVHKHYINDHPDPKDVEFYLCGPPAMIAATVDMLSTAGVSESQVIYDEF
jgi:Na+-transporting NADH:ubiquinone oxidoreductase subunit F